MSTPETEENSENVTGVVRSALEAVSKHQGEKKSSKGWIFAVIAAILAAVAIAILYWRLRRRGKELAKLKHERDVTAELEIQAQVAAEVAENSAQVEAALERVDEANLDLAIIEQEIRDVEARQEHTAGVIHALRTWEDVDRYLNRNSNEQTSSPNP